jgi:N-hydroxyarylamine O-acetyltransferase
MPQSDALDLDRYLTHIGYDRSAPGALDPTLATLTRLHRAHTLRVPFENIDVQLGLPIRLDLESLQAKIIGRARGGYCFEHNTLFAAVLRRLGFRVTSLAGRVRFAANAPTPRTHLLLRVDFDDAGAKGAVPIIADVGFGGDGPITPLPFVMNEEQSQPHDTYRFVSDGHLYRLEVKREGVFQTLYAFTLEEHFPVDYDLSSYFTSTHPQSRFVQNLIATRPADGCRYFIFNREFGIRRGDQVERRAIRDDEIVPLLERYFGIHVDPTSRFRALEGER